jgi:hypothetical protein
MPLSEGNVMILPAIIQVSSNGQLKFYHTKNKLSTKNITAIKQKNSISVPVFFNQRCDQKSIETE